MQPDDIAESEFHSVESAEGSDRDILRRALMSSQGAGILADVPNPPRTELAVQTIGPVTAARQVQASPHDPNHDAIRDIEGFAIEQLARESPSSTAFHYG